jgi:hypothetical protein
MGLVGREFRVDSMTFSHADDERQENLKLTEGEVTCSWCGKKIKDKPELGDQVSHGICPACEKKHFGDLEKDDEVDEDSPLYGTDMTEAVMESSVDITQRGYDLSLRFGGVPTERPSGGSQQRYDYLDELLPQMQSAFKSRGRLKRFSMDTITFQPWERDWDALDKAAGMMARWLRKRGAEVIGVGVNKKVDRPGVLKRLFRSSSTSGGATEDTFSSDVSSNDTIPITRRKPMKKVDRMRVKRKFRVRATEEMSKGVRPMLFVVRPGEVTALDSKPVWSALRETGVINVRPFQMSGEEFFEISMDTSKSEWGTANVQALLAEVESISAGLRMKIEESASRRDRKAALAARMPSMLEQVAVATLSGIGGELPGRVLRAIKLKGVMPDVKQLAEALSKDEGVMNALLRMDEAQGDKWHDDPKYDQWKKDYPYSSAHYQMSNEDALATLAAYLPAAVQGDAHREALVKNILSAAGKLIGAGGRAHEKEALGVANDVLMDVVIKSPSTPSGVWLGKNEGPLHDVAMLAMHGKDYDTQYLNDDAVREDGVTDYQDDDDYDDEQQYFVGNKVVPDEINKGDRIDAGAYGVLWVVSVTGLSDLWTSEYPDDIESGRGRGLRNAYVEAWQPGGKGRWYDLEWERGSDEWTVTGVRRPGPMEDGVTDPGANLSAMGVPSGSPMGAATQGYGEESPADPAGPDVPQTGSAAWQPGGLFKLFVLDYSTNKGRWVYRQVVGHEGEELTYKSPEGRMLKLPHEKIDQAMGFGGAVSPEDLTSQPATAEPAEFDADSMQEPNTLEDVTPMTAPKTPGNLSRPNPDVEKLQKDSGFSTALARYLSSKNPQDWEEVRRSAERSTGKKGPELDAALGSFGSQVSEDVIVEMCETKCQCGSTNIVKGVCQSCKRECPRKLKKPGSFDEDVVVQDDRMAEAFAGLDVQRAMDRYEATKNEGYLVRASELISRKTASGVREARAFVSKVLESAASMRSGK